MQNTVTETMDRFGLTCPPWEMMLADWYSLFRRALPHEPRWIAYARARACRMAYR